MSLVKRYFLSNYTYKTVSACCSLFKETRINRAQYSCLYNSANVQSTIFNDRKSEENNVRNVSIMASIRDNSEKAINALTYLKGYFPNVMHNDKRLGHAWFQTLDDLNAQEFFTLLKMEDSFYSWFKVVELHVWMLLSHLPKEGRRNRSIRIGVINALWFDTESRFVILAKEQKFPRKKAYKFFYREFMCSLVSYDIAFRESDMALASALWECFFNKLNVDPRILEALTSYVRYQMHHLNGINYEALHNTENKTNIWTPLRPHVERIINI